MKKSSQPIQSNAAAQDPDDDPFFSRAIFVLGGVTLGTAVILALLIISGHL